MPIETVLSHAVVLEILEQRGQPGEKILQARTNAVNIRRRDDDETSGPHNPPELPHEQKRILQMLDRLDRDDQIERVAVHFQVLVEIRVTAPGDLAVRWRDVERRDLEALSLQPLRHVAISGRRIECFRFFIEEQCSAEQFPNLLVDFDLRLWGGDDCHVSNPCSSDS